MSKQILKLQEIVKFVDVYIEMNSKPLYARTFKE